MKKRTTVCVLMLLASILTSVSLTSSQPEELPTPIVYTDPFEVAALWGTNFTVDLKIKNVTDFDTWQALVEWDLKILRLTGEWGPLMNQEEGWVFLGEIENSIQGNITLKSLTFEAVGLGQCELRIEKTKLFNSSNYLIQTPPYLGDVNGDLKVDVMDGLKIADALASSEGQPRYNPNADFNNDSFIDFFDLLCYSRNFMTTYPSATAKMPMEMIHQVQNGSVTVYSQVADFTVTWKWLDYYDNPVWITANVSFAFSSQILDFNFDRTLGQITFDLNPTAAGFCNITVPKLLMDGAFTVLINGTETASILTWNKTHTFVYFTHGEDLQNVAILGDIVTRIRAPNLITMSDVNGDGTVDILDVYAVAARNLWEEDP
jgi:hypothetical protein